MAEFYHYTAEIGDENREYHIWFDLDEVAGFEVSKTTYPVDTYNKYSNSVKIFIKSGHTFDLYFTDKTETEYQNLIKALLSK